MKNLTTTTYATQASYRTHTSSVTRSPCGEFYIAGTTPLHFHYVHQRSQRSQHEASPYRRCPYPRFPLRHGRLWRPIQGSRLQTHPEAAVSANKSVKIKGTSPDDIRDSLDQIIKTYKKANKKITNKKVKAAFTPLIEDLEKLRDATKSPGASTGGPDLMTDMSNHGKALNDLCGFDWGTGQ